MLGIRWTLGDVNPCGFEALRLSTRGAWSPFDAKADYWVFVNKVSVSQVRDIEGPVPDVVTWPTADAYLPERFRARALDDERAEGVAWKLASQQCFPDPRELARDNDVILWDTPEALTACLADPAPESCLLVEDVTSSLRQFASMCGGRALDSGIRGLSAGSALEARLRAVLDALRRFECDAILAGTFTGSRPSVCARYWAQYRAERDDRVWATGWGSSRLAWGL